VALECRECQQQFIWTVGQQEFYQQKGLTNVPTRCKECNASRKAKTVAGGGCGPATPRPAARVETEQELRARAREHHTAQERTCAAESARLSVLDRLEHYRRRQATAAAAGEAAAAAAVAVVDTNCLMSERELGALKALFAGGVGISPAEGLIFLRAPLFP
jgi:hypothetical protein